eukprot:1204201-Rhodomonas_salina.1
MRSLAAIMQGSMRAMACRAAPQLRLFIPAAAHRVVSSFSLRSVHCVAAGLRTLPWTSSPAQTSRTMKIPQRRSAHTVAESCRGRIHRRHPSSPAVIFGDDADMCGGGRLSSNVWAKLETRGVVRVVGADAITFLQGMTTNDVKQLGQCSQVTCCAKRTRSQHTEKSSGE